MMTLMLLMLCESYVEGDDVEVTKASRLHAVSTFTKNLLMQ